MVGFVLRIKKGIGIKFKQKVNIEKCISCMYVNCNITFTHLEQQKPSPRNNRTIMSIMSQLSSFSAIGKICNSHNSSHWRKFIIIRVAGSVWTKAEWEMVPTFALLILVKKNCTPNSNNPL